MNQELKSLLEDKIGPIHHFSSVGGGDISRAYHLNTASGQYFIKIHKAPDALRMFQVEKLGLESIADTGVIKTPRVFIVDWWNSLSFCVMDFIESKTPDHKDFQQLGVQLARLHRIRQSQYGWDQDNFIGTLEQSNKPHPDWPDFYVQERLHPQILLAQKNGFFTSDDVPVIRQMQRTCRMYLNAEYPSLIHGDLWGGNFLIGTDGTPYLIDPASYYGHYGVDIAMSQLFGGFDLAFYNAYYKESDNPPITQAQTDLYQLYYLLVHLNLFGRSYYSAVKKLIQKYFKNLPSN